jgi:hypothetical protein
MGSIRSRKNHGCENAPSTRGLRRSGVDRCERFFHSRDRRPPFLLSNKIGGKFKLLESPLRTRGFPADLCGVYNRSVAAILRRNPVDKSCGVVTTWDTS